MTAVAKRAERIVLSRRPLTAEQLAAVRGGGIGTSPSVEEAERAALAARLASGVAP